ncbi:hypothetical protein [Rubrivirga sp.]
MTRTLFALAVLAAIAHHVLQPIEIDLDGLSADAPAWVDQLVGRNP